MALSVTREGYSAHACRSTIVNNGELKFCERKIGFKAASEEAKF